MSTEILEKPVKKPHPFSKEARDLRAKEEVDIKEEERELTFQEKYGLPDIDPNKTYLFEFLKKKLNPNEAIPNRCEILDKKDGNRIRIIRYAPHEDSLFQDEQSPLPNGGYFVDEIGFPNSECRVSGKRKNLVYFLMMHNANEANFSKEFKSPELQTRHPLFKLVDKESDAEKLLAETKIRKEATDLASECSFDDMIPFAKILGIDISDAKEREKEIRYKFIVKSTENPALFIKRFNDPKNKRLYIILKAFEQGLITDTHIKNEVHWRGSKVLICNVPAEKLSSDYLADYSFTSKGEEFYKELVKLVD